MQKNNTVSVYTAPLIQGDTDFSVYPKERQEEILSCTSKKVRLEKYTAWKLLEKALKEQFDLDLTSVKFSKTPNGKWTFDKGYFSISHSFGIVAVALSKNPVGIDIERQIKQKRGLENRLLTKKELSLFLSLEENKKDEYLSFAWVKKESIFKLSGSGVFSPTNVESESHKTITKTFNINGEVFYFSLATKESENVEFFPCKFE